MKTYRAELHVHTVLSPCAQVEMIPPLIVSTALERGVSLIAITDHNATANIGAVQRAAQGTGLVVLPGMELQTREEVHVLCLFDTLKQAKSLQKIVNQVLPPIQNRPDFFGEQFIVDKTGRFLRREQRLLITSANLSLQQAWKAVTSLGGLFIPAHVNRKMFGLIQVLGLIPTDFPVEALEISRHISPSEALQVFPQLQGYPILQNSDVHSLDELIGTMEFYIETPTIAELRQALHHQNGRSMKIITTPVS